MQLMVLSILVPSISIQDITRFLAVRGPNKHCLAFSPGYGFKQLTWSVMPQGIKPASGSFQRTMSKTFNGNEHRILPPFYDDIIIKGNTFSEHIDNVQVILQAVKDAGFTLNVLKCSFFQKKINYLGHVIENGIISIDASRTDTIVSFPPPTNVKSLRRFIGMAQFCNRFIPKLNIIMAPLFKLLKTGVEYIWNSDCQTAFQHIKRLLSSAPVVHSPSVQDHIILETDASDIGAGCCLKGIDFHTKQEYIISYGSNKFSTTEENWNIVEKEAYAIVLGIQRFRPYLIGQKFSIRVDNRVVTYLMSKQYPKNKKLLGWSLQLSEYDFEIIHISSKNNSISDCLSRLTSVITTIYNIDSKLLTEQLKTAQQSEQDIQTGISYVSCNKQHFDVDTLGSLKRFHKHLQLSENGILLWKNKYVIPKCLRSEVLHLCHDHVLTGHFGIDRTHSNFSAKFFWPGAYQDVCNWVKSCKECNQFNPPHPGYNKAPLQPICTDHRFELVCYDFAGPFLPVTLRGNRYALIIVDHFSSYNSG